MPFLDVAAGAWLGAEGAEGMILVLVVVTG